MLVCACVHMQSREQKPVETTLQTAAQYCMKHAVENQIYPQNHIVECSDITSGKDGDVLGHGEVADACNSWSLLGCIILWGLTV